MATAVTTNDYHLTLPSNTLLFFDAHVPQENLRAVSVATELDGPYAAFDLRPGENLGVHVGLIQEFVDGKDRLNKIVSA